MRTRSSSSRPSASIDASGPPRVRRVVPQPHAASVEESSAGVAPTYTCAKCGAIVRWREVKFCLDRRARFGGRVYCLDCQRQFQAA